MQPFRRFKASCIHLKLNIFVLFISLRLNLLGELDDRLVVRIVLLLLRTRNQIDKSAIDLIEKKKKKKALIKYKHTLGARASGFSDIV
jgi:hypothetical protein